MTIHPIAVVDRVIDEYQRYLETEFRARDPGLRLALEEALQRPRFLAQEPFFQAHRPFKDGARWDALGLDAKLAKVLVGRTRSERAFLHQSEAITHLLRDPAENLVVTTGTGSGKSECFLLPVIQNAIEDAVRFRERPGITAILVYPMNALANDQEERIRAYLEASGHTYVRVARYDRSTKSAEREQMRKAPPNILLTNYMMLEYLLVRPADRERLFANHRCRYVVLDEVHTYRGSLGANIALLIRRLAAHLRHARHDDGPVDLTDTRRFPTPAMVATSATIKSVDETGRTPAEVTQLREGAVREFVSALTGHAKESFRVLGEEFRPLEIPAEARWTKVPVEVVLPAKDDAAALRVALARLAGLDESTSPEVSARHAGILWTLHELLARRPMSVTRIARAIRAQVPERADTDERAIEAEVRAALGVGAQLGDVPGALRLRAHRFIRGGWRFHRCVDPKCGRLYPMGEAECACGRRTAPLLLCRACGADALHFASPDDPTRARLVPRTSGASGNEWVLYREPARDDDDSDSADDDAPPSAAARAAPDVRHKGVVRTGSFDPETCAFSDNPALYPVPVTLGGRRNRCLQCGGSAGSGTMLTGIMLGTSAALRVLAEGVLESLATQHAGDKEHDGKERLLIFSDSRQDAAHQARFITYAGRYDRMRRRVAELLPNPGDALGIEELLRKLVHVGTERRDNPVTAEHRSMYLSKPVQERALAWEEAPLLDDLSVSAAYRATLLNLGLVGVRFPHLRQAIDERGAALAASLNLTASQLEYLCRAVLDELRVRQALSRPMLRYHPMHPSCPDTFEVAEWERRLRKPQGFACNEAGDPVGTLDASSVPEGIGVYNLWRKGGSGGVPRLQRVFQRLIVAMGHIEAQESHLLAVMNFLTETVGVVRPFDLHGARGKPRKLLQVNADTVELVRLGDADRFRCNVCNVRVPWVAEGTPCKVCHGFFVPWPAEEVRRNRYVERIVRAEELPLVAGEHTAQITTDERLSLEERFKAPAKVSPVNVLACSPTLEMGIDVGGLDAVLMRNVPPRPDNYAQRGGRAGRRSRVGVVVGYARNTPHDQYFYERPEEMIAGEVAAPNVSLGNRDVVVRHLNAIAMGAAEPGLSGRMCDYIGWRGEAKSEAIEALVGAFTANIEHAVAVARDAWGSDVLGPAGLDDPAHLRATLAEQPKRIRELFDRVRQQVITLQRQIEPFHEAGVARFQAWSASELIRRILGLPSENKTDGDADDRSEGHPMRRFAEFGVLPGYEFPSEPATLRLSRDRHEAEPLSVVRRFGLAQYQPEAPVNARGHRWRVAGLDVSSPWNPKDEAPSWLYRLCAGCDLRYDATSQVRCPRCGNSEAGGRPLPAYAFGGFLAVRDDRPVLDDEERFGLAALVRCEPQWNGTVVARYRLPTGEHAELRHEEEVRWINEGRVPRDNERHAALHAEARGFYLCASCGRTLTPPAPPAKTTRAKGTPRPTRGEGDDPFGHAKSCPGKGRAPVPCALTTRGSATTLRLRVEVPIDTDDQEYRRRGLSLGYALRTGLRQLYMLDGAEIEFELEPLWTVDDADGKRRAGAITFIDPSVGGSGFLERAATELHLVARRAMDHLQHENCETACYRCLKSYQNQRHHDLLAWPLAMETLEVLASAAPRALPVDRVKDSRAWLDAWSAGVGSPLELAFLRAFEAKGLVLTKQLPIAAAPGERAFTVADFALPEQRVAIYVDSRAFHVGSNLRRDQAIRDRLRAMVPPWRVERLTVDDLRAGLPSLRDLFGAFDPIAVPDDEAPPVEAPATVPWAEALKLLDARWHALAGGLRDLGVREPDEYELDLLAKGRVIETQGVMAWRRADGAFLALVPAPTVCDSRCVVAAPDASADETARRLAEEGVTS